MSTDAETLPAESKAILGHAVSIVAAFVGHNVVQSERIPEVLRSVHNELAALAGITASSGGDHAPPAVSVKKSITDEHIICLEDGKKLRTLKRYLKTQYDLTPEQYRAKWNLPRDYPMVAPSYTRLRSAFAKKIGLGRVAHRPERKGRGKRGTT